MNDRHWTQVIFRFSICLSLLLLSLAQPARAGSSQPLFVVLGGFASCYETSNSETSPLRTYVWKQFQDLIAPVIQAKTGTFPGFLSGCFGFSGQGSFGMDPDLRLFGSFDLDEVDIPAFPIFSDPTPDDAEHLINSLMEKITSLAEKLGGPEINLIGHSYGGWLSAQVAQKLIAKHLPVRALYTIDPISPLTCNSWQYVRNFPNIPKGCQEAPADLSHEMRLALRDQILGSWLNFFETDHGSLHSGAIPELPEESQDFEIKQPTLVSQIANWHLNIALDERVWNKIREAHQNNWRGSNQP